MFNFAYLAVKDYYTILGLPPQATLTDVRKAYRALARQYHPDTNNNDAYALARFMEVKEAYEVLTNPRKKQQYLEERWVAAFHAQPLQSDGPVTPETVLKRVLLYEKKLQAQDIYRMNKEAAAAEAQELLNTQVIDELLRFNDAEANAQIVLVAVRILHYLPYPFTATLVNNMLRLAGNAGTPLYNRVMDARRQQQKQYSWNRYYWVVVLVATFLLLALIGLFTAGR